MKSFTFTTALPFAGLAATAVYAQSTGNTTTRSTAASASSNSTSAAPAASAVPAAPAAPALFASAYVTGEVEARLNFTYIPNVGVQVYLYGMQNFTDVDLNRYPYHIHMNAVDDTVTDPATRCAAAMYHLDPLNVTESLICNTNLPQLCQEGDLSGKHGGINAYPLSGVPPPRNYTDAYLRFFPQPFSILGRSVVIHGAGGVRIACGNIISTLDGTADANGNPTNQASNYQNDYASVDIPAPTTSILIANGDYGTTINSAGIASASLTLPASAPAVSALNDVILTTSGGLEVAAAAASDYTPGASLPTQFVPGASAAASSASLRNAAGAANKDGSSTPPATEGKSSAGKLVVGSFAGLAAVVMAALLA